MTCSVPQKLPSLRAVSGLRLEVSLGTWEPDPFLDVCFLIGNDLSCIAKFDTELGQAPTSHARPRDTKTTYGPQTWQRGLSEVEHTLSKFGGDPCPVRRGLAAAVKCYVRKARFFAAVEQNERSQSL